MNNFSLNDFPLKSKVYMDDEVWMVVKPNNGKIFMVPFNKYAKDRYISIAIEYSISFLNGIVTKIKTEE